MNLEHRDTMALQRQGSGTWTVGVPVSSTGDHKVSGVQRPSPGHSRMYDGGRSEQGGSRGSNPKNPSRLSKGKRALHTWRFPPRSAACVLVVCLLGLVALVLSGQFLMGGRSFPQQDDVFGKSELPQLVRSGSENAGKRGVGAKDGKLSGSDGFVSDALDWFDNGGIHIGADGKRTADRRDVARKQESGSLYNERGRDELVEIGARYEDRHASKQGKEGAMGEDPRSGVSHRLDYDEYDDDGGEEEVERKAEAVDDGEDSRRTQRARGAGGKLGTVAETAEDAGVVVKPAEQKSRSTGEVRMDERSSDAKDRGAAGADAKLLRTSAVPKPPRTKKRRHPATLPCDIDFVRTTEGLREPAGDAAFVNVSLSYVESEEAPAGRTDWVPKFGGHQSLAEREESFHAKDQTLQCGFVKGPDGKRWTGFELGEEDKEYLSQCHIAVSSCIFGAWDNLRTPTNKKMSNSSKQKVCFVMFVDQKSLDVILEEGQRPNDKGVLGLWKIVLIKNLPYEDGRRNGKVPKLLTHRLFPNARYSIWLDSKLRLHADPLLILERFLWRGKHEYAISNHYDRHCVWEEVAQNKKLNKFNHSVIDEQFRFYQREGLPRFNRSDPDRYLPSHVPEGSFIVRAHTPMSNLFSCLWFNEVERFTPRDQLSFAATYIKLTRTNPTKRFRLNMFKDCERKAIAKLYHHRTGVGNDVTHV